MLHAIEPSRFLIPVIAGIFFAVCIIIFPQYHIYYLPIIIISSLIVSFHHKMKGNLHLIVWSLLVVSIFFGTRSTTEELLVNQITPERITRIVLLSCLFVFVMFAFLLRSQRDLMSAFKSYFGWFLLYAIIAMGSAIYSGLPLLSLWKGFEVLTSIVISMYIYRKLNNIEQIKTFWNLNVLFLFLMIATIYVGYISYPDRALAQEGTYGASRLQGVILQVNPNGVGQMASYLVVIALITFSYASSNRNRRNAVLLFLFAMPALVMSYSRTSIIATILVATIILTRKNVKSFFLLVILSTVFIWAEIYYSFSMYALERGSSDSIRSLAGRVDSWAVAWNMIKESPFLGYGFYFGPRVLFADKIWITRVGTDNTYLDVLLSIGIVGCIPFIATIYTFIKTLIVTKAENSYDGTTKEFISIFTYIPVLLLFFSITEGTIQIYGRNLLLFLGLSICLLAIKKIKKIESSPNSQSS
jgi:O-antigen ligase